MKQIYEKQVEEIESTILNFPWKTDLSYANFLAQTYYFVAHSTQLLEVSCNCFGSEHKDHFDRFKEHIDEEKGHEKIAEVDLKNLGYKVSDFEETSQTRMLYEAQYYKIEHLSPLALLGYILFLEGISVEVYPKVFPLISEHYGKQATRFLSLHVEEDPDHLDKAFAEVQRLSESETQVVQDNLIQTRIAYQFFLEEAARSSALHEKHPQKSA